MTYLIILEGIDGSGKSTAAAKLVKHLNAHYVHHGVHPQVGKGLGRLYVESMLPALHGHRNVVLDRSWLSERPYGLTMRGIDRLGVARRRMLERIAMRVQTVVVRCDPGLMTSKTNYLNRKAREYISTPGDYDEIYARYSTEFRETALPAYGYSYVHEANGPDVEDLLEFTRAAYANTEHRLGTETAGFMGASLLIVGESYADLTDVDPLYQKPFCAFSGVGCSRWLTEQLDGAGVSERDLVWVNADHLHELDLWDLRGSRHVFALGAVAASACRQRWGDQVKLYEAPHPQYWKRFHAGERYPLVDQIATAMKEVYR